MEAKPNLVASPLVFGPVGPGRALPSRHASSTTSFGNASSRGTKHSLGWPLWIESKKSAAACAAYLEKILWPEGFICAHCAWMGEPYRFEARPQVVRCRGCRRDTALTAGTVMERTHSPLSAWFWGAYLTTTQTPGMSALQFQRQAGLKRYETAYEMLKRLQISALPNGEAWAKFESALAILRRQRKRGPRPLPLAERFSRHVDRFGPVPAHASELGRCWLWTGAINPRLGGYGVITVDGETELAHRVAFFLEDGRWPTPCCLHRCDNRACVRRTHLFEGTKKDNTQDMMKKRRGNVSKLSDADIQQVLSRRARGETQRSIAARLRVSESLVSFIVATRRAGVT